MFDADVDGAFGLWARCQSINKQWDVPSSHESRRLIGQIVFSAPIPIKLDTNPELARTIHRAQLELCPTDSSPASDAPSVRVATAPNGAVMHFVQPQDESQLLYAKLSVSVAQEDLNALWDQLSGSLVIEVKGKLIGVSYSKPLEMKGDEPYAAAEVKEFQLRVIQGETVPDSWFHERIHSDFSQALMDVCLPDAHGSQAHTVATEFARSMAQTNLDPEPIRASLARARLLIREARPAFREALKLSPEPWDAWTYSPQDFEKAIADRDDERVAKMKRQYDQLWKHFSVTTVVLQGEEKHGAALDGFQPNVESLEYLAEKLLTDQKISSPTLEWAIIDALIYAECIAFAQTTLSGQSILGMTVPGQLKGLSTPKAVGKRFLRSISAVAVEIVKVGGTFFLAAVLAQENVETAWLITTGVTAARWIRSALLQKNKRPEVLHLELLNKMASVHELLKTTNFNARGLRDQLYRVAAEGAVFSPWVYNILDARISREGKPG